MPELLYERANIVAEVQTRFATKQREVGTEARQTQVAMAYFTGPLSSEPLTRLLRQSDPNPLAMHMRDAFLQLNANGQADFVRAVGYGVAGVLGYRLGKALFEPWRTEEFFDDAYNLFFAKAHLNKPTLVAGDPSEAPKIEAQIAALDAQTTQAIRETLRPGNGTPGKIGDFFGSYQALRRLPSIDMVVGSWVHPSLTGRVLEAGQSFQAAVDAITPKTQDRPVAKNFLEGLDL